MLSPLPSHPAASPCLLLTLPASSPCSIVLDRDEDMQMTGQRHAFMGQYKVVPGQRQPPRWGGVQPFLAFICASLMIAVSLCCRRHCASPPGVQVGFTREGRLLAMDLKLYCNAGNSLDLTCAAPAAGRKLPCQCCHK